MLKIHLICQASDFMHSYATIYIYMCVCVCMSSTDRLIRCITILQCGLTRNTPSQDQNLPNFYVRLMTYPRPSLQLKIICQLTHMYQISSVYIPAIGCQSAQFIKRVLHYASGNRYILNMAKEKNAMYI